MIVVATLASPSLAASTPEVPSQIKIFAVGEVKDTPDIATLSFTIRGEGATADAATRALVGKRGSIDDGLAQFRAGGADLKTSNLSINPARSPDCDKDDYREKARLSDGPCAIRGYVAALTITYRTSAIADAGTMLGMASRLGANDAEISGYQVRDEGAARKRALVAAVANGKAQAEAIAAAAGGHLGHLIRIEDAATTGSSTEEIIATAQRNMPSPPSIMIPVKIDLSPAPITTTARLIMTFELAR